VPAAKQKFLISTSVRRTDGVHVRIVSAERPGAGAVPASPTLEDAYLHCISSQRAGVAA
jgi:ABC-2 type transport system ATP-binding protein